MTETPVDAQADARRAALDEIAALARRHDLTADDIAAHMLAGHEKTADGQASLIVRLLSYIGGILVFTGIGYLVSLQWDQLSSAMRVLVTFGPGIVALVLGIAMLRDPRYVRAATPLFTIAAFLQPAGLFVMLSEYAQGNDTALAAMIVFTPLTLQMALLFHALRRTSLAFFALIYGFMLYWAVMEKAGMDGDIIATIMGFSGLLVSAAVNRTAYRAFVPFTYFVAAMTFAGGLFALFQNSAADILLLLAAPLMIFASVKAQSRSFLCASALTMLGYLCYLTDRYFANMVGWPIALIVMGFAMILLSSWVVRAGRDIKVAQGR